MCREALSDRAGARNRRVGAMTSGALRIIQKTPKDVEEEEEGERGGRVWLRPQRGACEDEGKVRDMLGGGTERRLGRGDQTQLPWQQMEADAWPGEVRGGWVGGWVGEG